MNEQEALAERITEYFFVDGGGTRADRLALMVKTPTGERMLGGWGREPFTRQTLRILNESTVLPHQETAPLTAIRTLIAQWRAEAARIDGFHATMGTGYHVCADQLEAALASPLAKLDEIRGLAEEMQIFAFMDAEREYVQCYGRALARILGDLDHSS